MPIAGSNNNGVVFESSKTLVMRCTTNIQLNEADQEPDKTYIVKISKQLSDNDGTERDYDISLYLQTRIPKDCIGKVFYFDKKHNSSLLVKEDLHGASDFAEYLSNAELSMDLFFKCAIRLCQILGYLHKCRVLHLDIKVGI